MNKEHILTKISLDLDIIAVVVMLVDLFDIVPYLSGNNFYGLFMLPPIFGILGIIPAIIGQVKRKSTFGKVLITVNIIFICWMPIVWHGGTLLFEP